LVMSAAVCTTPPLPQNSGKQAPRNKINNCARENVKRLAVRKMKLAFLAFTEKGFALAGSLAQSLGGSVMRCGKPDSLLDWTQKHFADDDGLVFVGAVGIAVRAIAPYIEKKWKDPAVVAVDECAQFAVPLLSGHLGGA